MSGDADRHVSPYTMREKMARVLWATAQATLFRLSFHNCYGWRRFLLRRFGASIGRDCIVRRTARIEMFQGMMMSTVRDNRQLRPTDPPNIRRTGVRRNGICQRSRPNVAQTRRTSFCFVVQAERRAGGADSIALFC